jgi:hypothetical protein
MLSVALLNVVDNFGTRADLINMASETNMKRYLRIGKEGVPEIFDN